MYPTFCFVQLQCCFSKLKIPLYLDCSKEEHLLGRLFRIQGKKVQAELN